ncbi:MAG: Mur ligase family protein, partial [Thalassobaculaceae bacterium]
GMEGYVAAKRQIFRAVTDDGVCVVGADDSPARATANALGAGGRRVVAISATALSGDGVFSDAGQVMVRQNDQCRKLADLTEAAALPGAHNGQNAAAATALALDLGLDDAAIARGLLSFAGLAHRQERIRALDGVAYINDSKATNAEAAARALACYAPIYWIAGGRAKDGGIAALSAFFPRVRHAYLIGEAARDFARDLEGHAPYSLCGALPQAVDQAHHRAQAEHLDGATVLLAPAAASFDQFDSFEARGDAFRQQVMALTAGQPREARA